MTVGLLLISHNRIGEEMLATAVAMIGKCPMQYAVIDITPDSDPDVIVAESRKHITALDQGAGVIVLTDMYGSTPSNIATASVADDRKVIVITGLNLPMLVRMFNYPHLDIGQLGEKALSGGRDGILIKNPGN